LREVDNTLLDNDLVSADLNAHHDHEFGKEHGDLYWNILDELRNAIGAHSRTDENWDRSKHA
jgi:hypothetical protein